MKRRHAATTSATVEQVHEALRVAFDLKRPNSVAWQVRTLIWDACVARAWFKATVSLPSADNHYGHNWIFLDCVQRWYKTSHGVAIRRLVEFDAKKPPREPEWERGVYSLRWAAHYLLHHHRLLTREGLSSVLAIPSRDASESGQSIHNKAVHDRFQEQFDRLRGTDGTRSGSDYVSEQLLKRLVRRLDQVNDQISPFVNKFVAHAASEESAKLVSSGPSPKKYHAACMSLARAYWWIDLNFVRYVDVDVLESSPQDGMDNLTSPLLPEEVHQLARAEWTKYAKQISKWRRCYTVR